MRNRADLVGGLIRLAAVVVLGTTALGASFMIVAPGSTSAAAAASESGEPAMLRGANISGGDFGKIPGTYGTDYTYPTEAEVAYYARAGFNALRVPFLWERVQHDVNGALDQTNDGSGDFDRVRELVGWITQRGMVAILDVHNYARRKVDGETRMVGSKELPAAALSDLWLRLSEAFKDNERVWFGLMNEPYDISADAWKAIAQTVTNDIRASGARNKILVPGTSYSGAHSWVSSGNAEAMASFTDPADNFAFDIHQYLDADSSGRSGTCVAGAGASRLSPFVEWAKSAPGRKGFLSEFAAGDPSVAGQEQCASELKALLDAAESSGVFIGWTAWGGGPWWQPSYIFRLEPADLDGPATNYMRLLRQRIN